MVGEFSQAILDSYSMGVFPMADSRDAEATYFVQPDMRGIIPLDDFNIPRSLKKFMATCDYQVTINQAFDEVIKACAETPRGADETGTWINAEIEEVFLDLHAAGHTHSIEVWSASGDLIGGLYGLAQGGCFNGESMFSRTKNASKIALVHLVRRLKERDFTLLDTQFSNPHLKQFGCIDIPHEVYMTLLREALRHKVTFV